MLVLPQPDAPTKAANWPFSICLLVRMFVTIPETKANVACQLPPKPGRDSRSFSQMSVNICIETRLTYDQVKIFKYGNVSRRVLEPYVSQCNLDAAVCVRYLYRRPVAS